MRAAHSIPADVRRLQKEVANPAVSAWVAANAGAGKTHVLAQRVINLLLEDVEPEKILCITFTKAAAANMAKRVFDTLGEWTTLGDAALDQAIAERSTTPPDASRRALARRLFARALETPGGLKVQTIHAFCTQLLHQFPFEGNIAARFSVLDESAQAHLLEQLTLGVLLDGANAPDSPLGRALSAAMAASADRTFREVVREAIGRRDPIVRWIERADSIQAAIAALSQALGVDPSESGDSIEDAFFSGSSIAPQEWTTLAVTLAKGSKSDAEQARRFASLASLSHSDRVETYLEIFCTADSRPRKSIVTKAIKDGGLVERLRAEQDRVCALLDRRRAVACRDRTAALVTVVYEVLQRYGNEKDRRGLTDYDDLIDKALDLLRNVDAAWVHYKLDLGIDHLLIDEAQDTSAKQWEIVQRLVAEFTAGAGARTAKRTIFAVGDEKQSIYSFQNAAPKEFAEMRRLFERRHKNAELGFVFREFKHSLRSGRNVLAAVDAVFKDIAPSVSSDSCGFPPHIALPDAPPSMVEIWQPTEPGGRRDIEGWDAPFDQVSERSPRVKLAQRIARTVRRLIDDRELIGIERRPVRAGDVLILVRQRGELFEAIIRALKNERVEVAGADRLVLTEHIAIMDLMVLGDALLLPEDDLALATALRSPLFGFEDQDLFDIAWDRGRASLRTALARKSSEREIFAAANALLDTLAQKVRSETPFAFYAGILGAGGGRRRFLARLGHEANDALDEFLNLAFEYERREAPSLQGFLAWLREAQTEVKRDMEIARDEVRVMTVHGAKGLEAPVVFLVDTMTPPAGPKQPRLLELSADGAGAMIWAGRKDDDTAVVSAARQQTLGEAVHEYRRLLYVAMTRAADRLIICGAEGRKKRPAGCWYDLVRGALDPFLVEETEHDEKVWRYQAEPAEAQASPATPPSSGESAAARSEFPPWLRQPVRAEGPSVTPLSHSSFDEDVGRASSGTGFPADRQRALERGRKVHRLMQLLPDIPVDRRGDAAAQYLARAAADFSPDERSAVARQVLAMLDDRNFAEVFAPGSRAEVPIVGRLQRPDGCVQPISGQVDRLTVTNDSVLVADYKTDRVVPRSLNEVPENHVKQLALYRAVISRLYPVKAVRAALVFTAGPALIEVSAAAMETALAQVLATVTPR